MARGRSDIANTAVRIFLADIGEAYDEERGLPPYNKAKHFQTVQDFFDGRCCYCGADFAAEAAVEDHLVPTNRTDLGLHAWGNVVPACRACNSKKQGSDWRDFIIRRAEGSAGERHARMTEFLKQYPYRPSLGFREIASELYEEVGALAMTLITAKIKRARATLAGGGT